jgi:hypothetical protein
VRTEEALWHEVCKNQGCAGGSVDEVVDDEEKSGESVGGAGSGCVCEFLSRKVGSVVGVGWRGCVCELLSREVGNVVRINDSTFINRRPLCPYSFSVRSTRQECEIYFPRSPFTHIPSRQIYGLLEARIYVQLAAVTGIYMHAEDLDDSKLIRV